MLVTKSDLKWVVWWEKVIIWPMYIPLNRRDVAIYSHKVCEHLFQVLSGMLFVDPGESLNAPTTYRFL